MKTPQTNANSASSPAEPSTRSELPILRPNENKTHNRNSNSPKIRW